MNPDRVLPELSPSAPKGGWITKKVDDLEINYYSTAIARGLTESGVDFFITVKNTGSSKADICSTSMTSELREILPKWNLHFFMMQDSLIEIRSGQEKKIWFYASVDQVGTFDVELEVGKCSGSSVKLPVTFGSTDERFWGKETTTISGTVKDEEGNPVTDTDVLALMNCGRVDFKAKTDNAGKYEIAALAKEDIDAIYLGKDLACDSTDYYVLVEKEGYQYYYNGHVLPTRKEPVKLDIVLKKASAVINYKLAWEKRVQDNFGFFWVKPSSDWSVFAAAQSKHPPELNKPTNFYLFDINGKILWKQPTSNECWGIDIAKDGSKVIAGCHDSKVYAVDKAGKLLWPQNDQSMISTACISDDGS